MEPSKLKQTQFNSLNIPGAEPFLFPGNHIGVLLIHGFTGSPRPQKLTSDS